MPVAIEPQVKSCTPGECRRIAKKAIELHPVLEDPTQIAERARLFQALGNDTRLKIVGLFAVRELCVCDIVAALKVPASTLAHHLRMLEEASVITRREEGKFTLYSLDVEVLRKHRVFE